MGGSVQADITTWGNFSGTTSFTDPAAWQGGLAPSVSGTALFNAAASASPNLATSTTISSLQFSTAASSGYNFTNSSSAVLSLSGLGATTATAAIASLNTTGSNVIGTDISLIAASGSTQSFSQASGGTLVFNGTIASTNSIRLQLQNTGTYVFNAANTFSGTLTQSAGNTLIVGNKDALGTSVYNALGANSKIQANTTLTGANKITNNIVLGTTLGISDGGFALELGGNIDMGGAARSIASGGLTFASGPILSGVISNDGGGGLTFSRNAVTSFTTVTGTSNSYTGLTTINGLNLAVTKIGMAGSTSSLGTSGTVQLGVASQTSSLVYIGSGETTDKTFAIVGTGGGSIDTTGATGALVFTSSMTMTTAGGKNLILRGDTTGNRIEGEIRQVATGTLGITKQGTGTWILAGNNTYTGTTTVSAGTLLIDGSIANSTVSVAGGILGGSGTIGGVVTISSTGTLSPGSSPGTLTINNNLNMLNGSTYIFEGGDLVDINGQLDLDNNWTLTLGPGFVDGGSVVLFTYNSIAGTPDLVPTINTAGLGFVPSGPLTLTDTGSSIVLNGISVIPEPSTVLLAGVGLALVLTRFRRLRRG